jgi:hypothetical protein
VIFPEEPGTAAAGFADIGGQPRPAEDRLRQTPRAAFSFRDGRIIRMDHCRTREEALHAGGSSRTSVKPRRVPS